MILHIPHSSTVLPKDFQVYSNISIEDELYRMTDWFTDELFDLADADKLVFSHSRLYCDVERFRNDEEESMAKKGMGVCYTHTSKGKSFREVSHEEAEHVKRSLYDAHHSKFEKLVAEALENENKALIIDCHSFSHEVLSEDFAQGTLSDICLGVDSFHADYALLKYAYRYFLSAGYTVAINEPFSGTIVPMKYYQKDKRVKSMMIEVNRELYLDEKFKRNTEFQKIKNLIKTLLNTIEMKK